MEPATSMVYAVSGGRTAASRRPRFCPSSVNSSVTTPKTSGSRKNASVPCTFTARSWKKTSCEELIVSCSLKVETTHTNTVSATGKKVCRSRRRRACKMPSPMPRNEPSSTKLVK